MVLRPWQKEISKEEYMKELETSGGFSGIGFDTSTGKYYKSDQEHPEKQAIVADRLKRRKEKQEKRAATLSKLRDKCKSAYQRGLEVGIKRGSRLVKPKMDLQNNIAKKEARLAADKAKLEALKAKVN